MATQIHHNYGQPSSLFPTPIFNEFDDGVCNLQRKTPLQLQTLENLYSDDKHPTQSRVEDYASALGLTYEQVRRWFVERRRRDKQNAARTRGGNVPSRNTSKRKCKTKNKKNMSNLVAGEDGNGGRGHFLLQDLLYSPEYMLHKVCRKDGPPLGLEFDSLPSTESQGHCASPDILRTAYQDEQRALKRMKASKCAHLDTEQQCQVKAPVKKHGMGKGLMSVFQLKNSKRRKVPACKDGSLSKKHGRGKGLMAVLQLANSNSANLQDKRPKRQKRVIPRMFGRKPQGKKKPRARQGKVELIQNENQKAYRESCKFASDLASYEVNQTSFAALEDDEELEMRELQAGPNPLTCSAHFSTGGTNGCSLCKGLLPNFPPDSVIMRKPLTRHPWNSCLELVKKFFKAFHFLYTYAVTIDVCPFTFDDFEQAFHEKDSFLLGKLHMRLLEFLLSDIEKELSDGLSIHSSKNCMFSNLLHSVGSQKFMVNFWRTSLNPLTWIEILRQVLVAAGFGSKNSIPKYGFPKKGSEHFVKHGLSPGTLKGELFSILSEQGNKGMQVFELVKSPQIVDLNLAKTDEEIKDVICSTLAGDITLFEKISSSAYRLRSTFIMRKDEDAQSDNEGCGSIDDEFRDCTTHSTNSLECDSRNTTSAIDSRNRPGENNINCTEIDESHTGESWLLGLMEGEYSDLSIQERLNALLALIDLLSAGSSLRMEDPVSALAECVPSIYQHGTGGKIKRSVSRQFSLPTPSQPDVRETSVVEKGHPSRDSHPVDSSIAIQNPIGKESNEYLHPMQSRFLGSDRRYNRYWLFLGPCDTNDSGHKRIYFESSEDGHWEVIDSEEVLCSLLSALNSQGRREAVLLASMEKCTEIVLDEMSSRVQMDAGFSHSMHSDMSEMVRINEDSPSPMSDIDSNLSLIGNSHSMLTSAHTAVFEDKKVEELKQKYARLQAYDSWIWNSYYSGFHAVKHGKRSYFDSLTRCGSCHDLYWRDERHCKICHITFELDFDLEEKYAIHVATCQRSEDVIVCPMHKILPSQLQALKAAVHALELAMPDDALVGAWRKSAHNLWVRRLRRTSSLHELSQVVADFVGAISVDWLSQCNVALGCDSKLEDIVASFHSMPQTSSAVALWLVKLDSLIASRLNEGLEGAVSQ